MAKTVRRILWILAALIVTSYTAAIIRLAMDEPGQVFPRDSTHHLSPIPEKLHLNPRRIQIRTDDLVALACWEIPLADARQETPWIICFHGNAQNVSDPAELYRLFLDLGLNVLGMEFRGYGESDGTPSEAGLYRDADAGYRYLTQEKGIPPQRILLYGYSLGSAVAIDLASREKIAGLIVEGAFTSIPDIGQELYPYIPVKLVAKNRFASIKKIGRIRVPKFFIHGRDDSEVPFRHGQTLYRAAAPPKEFLEFPGGGHHPFNEATRPVYFQRLSAFLAQALART